MSNKATQVSRKLYILYQAFRLNPEVTGLSSIWIKIPIGVRVGKYSKRSDMREPRKK